MASRFINQAVTSQFAIVKTNDTDEPRCHNCIYFVARPRLHSNSNIYGECRRNPPSNVPGENFPGVEKNDFCGEWHDGRNV